ncbi:hypothetical protein RF11_15742 [Thelohanellus kitauei]|uniref:Uncharacterized protein n=1 Tax=Thelohanellus kitauei TaxID=669202 RepID=A0A0C2MKP1_THEKT|nr:hypothetical protein RF11_15742 [Thelohanellus kitauei]
MEKTVYRFSYLSQNNFNGVQLKDIKFAYNSAFIKLGSINPLSAAQPETPEVDFDRSIVDKGIFNFEYDLIDQIQLNIFTDILMIYLCIDSCYPSFFIPS